MVIAYVGNITVKYSSKSKGSLKSIGEIRLAKINRAKARLKMMSPNFGTNFIEAKYPIDASTVPNMQAPKRFKTEMTLEKSYMNSSFKTV